MHSVHENTPAGESLSPDIPRTLRPYQDETLDHLAAAAQIGIRRALVSLPTGAGKTVIFSALVLTWLARGRVLIIVHRDELLRQTADKLRAAGYEGEIGVVKAGRNEHTAPVLIASVQTLGRTARLARLTADYALVIVDEAHHATAASYRRVLDYLGCFAPDGPFTAGFTATPERADRQDLNDIWQGIVYHKDLWDMIAAGYLCNVRGLQIRIAADLDHVARRGGDYREGELAAALTAAHVPMQIAEILVRYATDRRTLVFVPGVAFAHETARVLQDAGIAAAVVTGDTPIEERQGIYAALRAGSIKVLVNCAVLTEGFDEPSIDCVMIARPTLSRPLYQQMIGRGTRIHPGKGDSLVLDLVGASAQHELVTLATLTRHDPAILAAGGIAAAAARDTAQTGTGPLVARPVDLFGRDPLAWLAVDGDYVLSTPDGNLAIRHEPDGLYAIWFVPKGWCPVPRELAARLPLDTAQTLVEQHARHNHAMQLIAKAAPCRDRAASEKQTRFLRSLGVDPARPLTMGEAANFITAALYRGAVQRLERAAA